MPVVVRRIHDRGCIVPDRLGAGDARVGSFIDRQAAEYVFISDWKVRSPQKVVAGALRYGIPGDFCGMRQRNSRFLGRSSRCPVVRHMGD
jgi:hypothetical protein